MRYELPTAQLVSCETDKDTLKTVVRFEELPSPPLAPASFGRLSEGMVIELHKVTRQAGTVISFITFRPQTCGLKPGETYSFTSWWTRSQLTIAQGDPSQWREVRFKASDMITFQREDGSVIGRRLSDNEAVEEGIVVPKGWDHEHCSLCWKTIAESGPYENSPYTDGSDWVCDECYAKYIRSGFGKKLGDLD